MRAALVVALLLVACGPSVAVEDEDGGGGTTGSVDTGATATNATNATSPSTADPTNATTATTVTTDPTTASTSTSVGEDTSESTTDEDDEAGFIQSPDGGGVGCGYYSQCDVWAQDCPDGEKCIPWDCSGGQDWNGNRCSPLDPDPAHAGEPCTVVDSAFSGKDDCDIASMCWKPDPLTLEGHCAAFCSGSEANPICDDPSTVCFIEDVISLCLPRCSPLMPTCARDEQCAFDGGESEGGFACLPTAIVSQAYGDDCYDALACGSGLVCQPAAHVPGCSGSACCTTLGDTNSPPACPDATQSCLPLYADGEAPAGLEHLCFCGVAE
jgi:hypothetical protein